MARIPGDASRPRPVPWFNALAAVLAVTLIAVGLTAIASGLGWRV